MTVTARSVLVVEDDVSFRKALARWLEGLGYAPVLASSAEHALQDLPRIAPEAVLLDLHLPGLSGHALIERLQASGCNAPAILMSGGAGIDDVIIALRQGVADFLRKPFRADDLAAALARARARPLARQDDAPVLGAPPRAAPEAAERSPALAPAAAGKPAAPVTEQDARTAVARVVDQIRRGTVALPVLDAQIAQLKKILSSSEPDWDALHSLVESDANFSANLLKTANSAYYSRGSVTGTVRQAFVRLGSRTVLNLVMGLALERRLEVRGALAEVARRQWLNSVATSRFCAGIAKLLRRSDAERLQLLGLLHNIGEPLLIKLVSEVGTEADIEALAAELLAAHEDVGLALMKSWSMPSDICNIVGRHHRASAGRDYDAENDRFIVMASYQLALGCGFDYLPGQVGEPAGPLAEIGLTEAAMASLCAEAKHWKLA